MHKKILIPAAAAFALFCISIGVAYGSGSEHLYGIASSATAINPTTCKFLVKEVDPPTGPTWQNLRQYSLYEDARHDAKMSCLTKRQPSTAQRIVWTSGTGQQVTATCPAGFVVTGGGSKDETTGSYASNSQSWTVVRDHLSPANLSAEAVCIRVGFAS